jgi:hypothetical protein
MGRIGSAVPGLRKPMSVVTPFSRQEAAPPMSPRQLETPTFLRQRQSSHGLEEFNEELLDIPAFLRAQAD